MDDKHDHSKNHALAQSLIQRHDAMRADRAPWDSFCQEIAQYVIPRKADIIYCDRKNPSTARQGALFDSTAVNANNVLANGQLSWMTPHETQWFGFDAPPELSGNDRVKSWFKMCTEVAHMALARSNFYSDIHEFYLDRGAFGTGVIFCDAGRKSLLRFENWQIGTFSISEDDEGNVDTVSREFEFTVRQAISQFGQEAVSDKIRKAWDEREKDPKRLDEKHFFIHMIYPREAEEIDPSKADPENMPFASVFIERDAKRVVRISGFRELPFFASRFLKWGRSVYGWSPAWIALPESRQLNFLEMNMDAMAEVMAFPRVLVPQDYMGDVDLRASGITYFDASNPNATPKEWLTGGRYDVGEARADRKRQAINDAFHVDLFKMFTQMEKPMTATEVMERKAEKLIQFSPTFARMTTELFNPLLQRIFSRLMRAGAFPQPPEEALLQDAGGGIFLPEPRISYSSKIAMAIKALENTAFQRAMGGIMPIAQLKPEILDNLDGDKITRDFIRNEGVPENWLLPMDTVEKMRQARAQAQQQAQQMAQMSEMMGAMGKAGSVKPDSAVGQAMAGAMSGGGAQ